MAGPTPETPSLADTPLWQRGSQEWAVLNVLVEHQRRVIGRRELSRLAGLANLNERRCDSVLVGIRKALGPDSVVAVRSRGWRLSDNVVAAAASLLVSDA